MDARTWFASAAAGFLEVVDGMDAGALDSPGLGVWDVRSLLGHTSRSFLTLEAYLRPDDPREVDLATSAAYFVTARPVLADQTLVAERGRLAGVALGDAPTAAVREIAGRVLAVVDRTSDDCRVETPLGVMTLATYLPTRAFELTVHGIDLARATDQSIPVGLVDAAVPAAELGAAMASPDKRVELLMAMTGRNGLGAGFSVL